MKSPESTQTLADHIVVHKSLITPELCDSIIAEYKDEEYIFGKHHLSLEKRRLNELNISSSEIINKSNSYHRKFLDSQLLEAVSTIADLRGYINCLTSDTGDELRQVLPGHYYKTHTDQSSAESWQLTVSVALNDDYEGGLFCFFDQELCYKLEKGDAISFPSNYMYPHQITTVESGTRYVIVTWIC